MKIINILITGVSSSNSITFIKGLRKQKEIQFKIIGTDIYEKYLSTGAQFCDMYFKVPVAKDASFVSELMRICKENEVCVLIPIIDEEFLPISEYREVFEKLNIKVLLPKKEVISICSNKIKLCQFLKDNNFPFLNVYLTPASIFEFPVVKKPIFGRGSRGIKIIYSKKELDSLVQEMDCFFQDYIDGVEFTVDTLSDSKGQVLAVVPRVRLEVKCGNCVKGQIVRNEIIEETAKQICKKLNMTGTACLQCIIDKDDIPYFFDINPRIGSATILTIEGGINIPFLAVKDLLGMELNAPDSFKENIIMLRYWNEVFTSVDK